jgi:hypothetical protein
MNYCSICLVWFGKEPLCKDDLFPAGAPVEKIELLLHLFGLVWYKNLYAKTTCSPLVRQLKRMNYCSICLVWFGTRTSKQRRPAPRWCAS